MFSWYKNVKSNWFGNTQSNKRIEINPLVIHKASGPLYL